MMRKGKLCKIVKLGSRTENHVNTEIQSIGEFNNLLKDYRHNKINTSSCYKANVVVSFRCSVYRKENKKYIIDKEGNPKIDPHSMMISFDIFVALIANVSGIRDMVLFFTKKCDTGSDTQC